MKHYLPVASALAVTLALVLAAGVWFVPRDHSGSSPKRTIYSFVSALKHHNYGRACSYMAQKQRGPVDDCAAGFVLNVGMGMLFGGVDAFAGIRVKPGTETCPDATHCSYVIDDPTGVIGSTRIAVAKQDNGLWRIEKIG